MTFINMYHDDYLLILCVICFHLRQRKKIISYNFVMFADNNYFLKDTRFRIYFASRFEIFVNLGLPEF